MDQIRENAHASRNKKPVDPIEILDKILANSQIKLDQYVFEDDVLEKQINKLRQVIC